MIKKKSVGTSLLLAVAFLINATVLGVSRPAVVFKPADEDLPTKDWLNKIDRGLSGVDRSKLAFPGAEGFGKHTIGGRDGKVLRVTRLEDDDKPGSFRWAVTQPYPRTVVFDVTGIISLNDDIYIQQPYLTIDGSTAPGAGVLIKDGTVKIDHVHDVIVRHLRVYPGDEVQLKKGKWENVPRSDMPNDGLSVYNSAYFIIDHCSVGWSSDEALSAVGSRYGTISNCIISEPLNNPDLHDGQERGYGSLISGDQISTVRNLYASLVRCAPQLSGIKIVAVNDALRMEAINNVVNCYGPWATTIAIGQHEKQYMAVVGNYYQNPRKKEYPEIDINFGGKDDYFIKRGKLYIKGNIGPQRTSDSKNEWALARVGKEAEPYVKDIRTSRPPYALGVSRIMRAGKDLVSYVLENAGATLPIRSSIDKRIVEEVKAEKGKVIKSQDEVDGYKPFIKDVEEGKTDLDKKKRKLARKKTTSAKKKATSKVKAKA